MTPYLADPDFTLYLGDVREVLRELPAGSVDCVVTSPPYWGLRDYGADGQIGLEGTPEEYVAALVGVFRDVRRVLADHGTVWLNLGDSYASAWACDRRNVVGNGSMANGKREDRPNRLVGGLKEKDLVGIPWRTAFALQADGWYLRSDIIWAKPNPMPESVTDRPTKSHEYMFLLAKQPRYFFDQDAVREPHTSTRWGGEMITQPPTTKYADAVAEGFAGAAEALSRPGREWNAYPAAGRNIRSVWSIATQPYAEAHFATFPEELPRRAIAAGCPEWVCAALVCQKCGVVHPTATVESLWYVERTGDTSAFPESDALQAELRHLRDLLREQESLRVLAQVPRDSSDEASGYEEAGRPDLSSGIHSPMDAGLSVGDDGEGLRAGASLRDGAASSAQAGAVGEGSPPERDQGRQPAGELGDRDPFDSPWSGRVPGLRDALLRSLACLSCGSSGFRTCGKPRERLLEKGETVYARHKRETGETWRDLNDRHREQGKAVRGTGKNTPGTLDPAPSVDLGWSDCGHGNYRPGLVLDPFLGSGTTAYVARKLGRHAVGVELNPEYAALCAKRLSQQSLFA